MDLETTLQQVLDELQQVRQQNSSLQALLDDVLSVLPPPSRTLTTGQAAEALGVSENTIRRYMDEGKLKNISHSSHARFDRAAVLKLAEGQKKKGRPRKAA